MENCLINVNHRYKSSTRIDNKHFDYKDFIDHFVVHGTALNTLDTITRDYSQSSQRCFTITGPYGTGKSTIALFLTQLLSQTTVVREYARQHLINKIDDYDAITSRFNVNKGWSVVKHVCGLASPAQSITISILSELSLPYDHVESLDDDKCLLEISTALNSVKGADGIVILLDELGKALDFQSRENKDLYFFQHLADVIQNSDTPAILIGFLHQAFSEYSKNMSSLVQKEWAKVQGRYRDIGYVPSIDESLILISDSISKSSTTQEKLTSIYAPLVTAVTNSFTSQKHNIKHLLNALPLDPVVSLLLGPISKRRFSQNERSLFGFIASNEQLGFKQFIEQHYVIDSEAYRLFTPTAFWDYLYTNLNHVISASIDSKAWLEGCDAVQRAEEKGSFLHVEITKLIALLTLFGLKQNLNAKRTFLIEYFKACGHKNKDITDAVKNLEDWSIIIYRQNRDALFVFQGSDIDINELVIENIELIKDGVNWSTVVDDIDYVLATAHYHKTGAMRWAKTQLVSSLSDDLITETEKLGKTGSAFINFLIPTSKELYNLYKTTFKNNEGVAIGRAASFTKLQSISIELLALRKILREHSGISHDRIAKNELQHRIELSEVALKEEIDSIYKSAIWTYSEKQYKNQPLSRIASTIADNLYYQCPVVINELVNRSKPSGSANGAIKKLLIAMSEDYPEYELGIAPNSFPAEKGLYYSCIYSKGLHTEDEDGSWRFSHPSDANLSTLFDTTLTMIKEKGTIISIAEVDEMWSQKPYGIAQGVRSIWLLALLMTELDNLAFYDYNEITNEPIFITEPDEEFAIKLMQKPSHVGVQYVKVDKEKTAYLNEISRAIPNFTGNPTPLSVAQAYVSFHSTLSTWTKFTKEISPHAQKFREVCNKASDPNDLLFKALPKVLNKKLGEIKHEDASALVNELRYAHKEMLKSIQRELSVYLQLDGQLVEQCNLVSQFTSDYKLKTFASRLSEFASNEHWLPSIISLLSGKAERNWDDNAIAKARTDLNDMIDRFKVALYRASFANIDYANVSTKYNGEFSKIKANLINLDTHEKQAILMSLLDEILKD